MKRFRTVLGGPLVGIFYGGFIILSLIAPSVGLGQDSIKPSNSQRMQTSMMQLISASSIKRGLSEDVRCKGRVFDVLPLRDFFDLAQKKDRDLGIKSKTNPSFEQFVAIINTTIETNIPNKGALWQTTYQMIKETVPKSISSTPGFDLCTSLNESAKGLFGKSMDNLRLIE